MCITMMHFSKVHQKCIKFASNLHHIFIKFSSIFINFHFKNVEKSQVHDESMDHVCQSTSPTCTGPGKIQDHELQKYNLQMHMCVQQALRYKSQVQVQKGYRVTGTVAPQVQSRNQSCKQSENINISKGSPENSLNILHSTLHRIQ